MKYYQISRTAEPKIIGVKTGGSQVELLQEKIVVNQNFLDFDNHFSGYNSEFWNSQKRVFELNPPVFHGRLRKNAKQTDLMEYGPKFHFLNRLYSEKFLRIIESFNTGEHKAFPFKIDNLDQLHYLLFFQTVLLEEINYERSIVMTGYHFMNNVEYHTIRNKEEYLNFSLKLIDKRFEKISIPVSYNVQDIIMVQPTSIPFYSEKLTDFLLDCKVTGLHVSDSIDLDFY